MLDFSKKLSGPNSDKTTNPIAIYDSLDRASDKGPLRPAQSAVLEDWYHSYKEKKDVIVKLHTGQGKTLIGLLILQSKLNSSGRPVLYLCPSKLLVEQTCEQARQFGFKFCRIDRNNQLPQEFLDGKSILITHVQLFFNGFSKFGLRHRSLEVDSIVLDDSHACIEIIQDAFTIKIKRGEPIYGELLSLFGSDLESQGQATTEEIKNEAFDAFLPVPYWAWADKNTEVISLLVKNRDKDYVRFAWELIKEVIRDCQCIISGTSIEISPYLNPIELFGSFSRCVHRVFMSATTNNDAFFIRGLGVELDVVKKPLKYANEKWSGEKMILIPYLINPELNEVTIVNRFGEENEKRKYGTVALTPSNRAAQYWEQCGAIMPDKDSIQEVIKNLREGHFSQTVVLSNRYDGIDLPDDTCRILILDSKPFAISLVDRLQEFYRENSKVINIKIAQKIEQGLGRAVRGEKDYCVILITGFDLIGIVRTKTLRKYFSAQTNKQIDIGIEIGQMTVEQDTTDDPLTALNNIINISLKRDAQWKKYYVQEMDTIKESEADAELLEILQAEKKAEELQRNNQHGEATKTIQQLIDRYIDPNNKSDIAYYLQEMARYSYNAQKSVSNNYQVQAYKLNRILLKPMYGIEFQKLKINKGRNENILNRIKTHEAFEDLQMGINEILNSLSFGVKADKFEKALNDLGIYLGFACERPDKEQKKGPDNLWNVQDDTYILFECKNEVDEERSEIIKSETGQINNACAWFKTNYSSSNVKNILIIPTKVVSAAAGFNEAVEVLRKKGLNTLKSNVRLFFEEFKAYELHSLTETQINDYLNLHHLTVNDILNRYAETPIQKK
ncbi:MAG TPA: DEAD/DEAH box helicase [Puia sp.]|nr:DEAD/DEAH box helicase [Puia sp.]